MAFFMMRPEDKLGNAPSLCLWTRLSFWNEIWFLRVNGCDHQLDANTQFWLVVQRIIIL